MRKISFLIAFISMVPFALFPAQDWKKEFIYSNYIEDISASKIKINFLNGKKTLKGSLKSDDLQGKVIILNFFATWCPPCVKELPEFQKFHDHYKKENKLSVLIVSAKELSKRVANFIELKGFSFPVALGDEATIRYFQIETLPTTLIADHSGIIRYRIKGIRRWEDPQFIKFFDELISGLKE